MSSVVFKKNTLLGGQIWPLQTNMNDWYDFGM